jgi:hypothetical protein
MPKSKASASPLTSPSSKRRHLGDTEDSVTTPRNGAAGITLQPDLLKQLAIDIERSGGIERIVDIGKKKVLARLLDQDCNTYGKQGDPIRRKIQDKVFYWKKLYAKGQYVQKVLDKLGVEERSYGPERAPLPPPVKLDVTLNVQERKNLSELISSSDLQVEGTKLRSGSTANQTDKPNLKSSGDRKDSDIAPLSSLLEYHTKTAIPHGAHYITVDTERPDNNREVYVFPCSGLKGVNAYKDREFDGYFIALPVDPRIILSEKKTNFYSCRVIHPNKVLLKMPSMHYALTNNDDRVQFNDVVPESVGKALDIRRNDFMAHYEERKFKYLVLIFPETEGKSGDPVHLTVQPIFEDAGEDNECEFEMIDIKYSKDEKRTLQEANTICPTCQGHPLLGQEFWAGFTVATKAVASNLGGEEKSNNQSANARKLLSRGGFFI